MLMNQNFFPTLASPLQKKCITSLHAGLNHFFQFILLLSMLSFIAPAQAGINQFVAGMSASGTIPFDALDANASNADIRTNDLAIYRVGYSISPSDPTATLKLTMGTFTLPSGYSGLALTQLAFFDALLLPTGTSGCQNISLLALTNAQIAAGNTSGVSADRQTLYCVQPANSGGNNQDFRVSIRGDAPNGATMNPPAFEFVSSSNPATTSVTALNGVIGAESFYGLPTLTVRASPRWNLKKSVPSNPRAVFINESGPPGSGPGGVGAADGYLFSWNVGIFAMGSRKGLEALGTANFTENWNNPNLPNAQLVTWSIKDPNVANTINLAPDFCANTQSLYAGYDGNGTNPTDDGNTDSTPSNISVARGGRCQNTGLNQAAKTATFSLTGTDWSLVRYPVRQGVVGKVLVDPFNLDAASNEWWVASKNIMVWVPLSDISAVPNPNSQNLTNTIGFSGVSVTGQPNTEPTTADNTAAMTARRETAGGLFKIGYPLTNYLSNPFNLPVASTDPVNGGGAVQHIGQSQVHAAAPIFFNSGVTRFGPGQICDKIDNTRLSFFDTTNAAYTAVNARGFKDAGTGVGLFFNPAANRSRIQGLVVELGIHTAGTTGGGWTSYNANNNVFGTPARTGSSQADTDCSDTSATWYPSVAALLAASKSLQEITAVRAKYTSWGDSTQLTLAIPMISRSSFAYATTDVGAGGGSFAAGASTAGAFSSNQARWDTGIAGLFGSVDGIGRTADTLQIVSTEYVQITKSSPTNPANTLVAPGNRITYALNINLTSSTGVRTTTVEVWDVLPDKVQYSAGSSTYGGAPLPDPVCASTGLPVALFPATVGPPATVAGNVPAGYKACKWTLNNQTAVAASIGATAGNLPQLLFDVFVDLNATPGNLFNTVMVDSSANLYSDAAYAGATNGFRCPNVSLQCSFSNWLLQVSSAAGISLSKQSSNSAIAPNGTLTYSLRYGSIGTALANLRVLDVLPYNGDGRSPASNFTSSLQLLAPVTPPIANAVPPATAADPTARVLYTNNTPASINRDPYGPSAADTHHKLDGLGTNSGTSTNWCTQVQFGSANFPANLSAATGVMVLPFFGAPSACPGFGVVPCTPQGQLYLVNLQLQSSGNVPNNIYTNDFRSDSPSLTARSPGSNAASVLVNLPDLVLAKSVSTVSVYANNTVTYTLVPRNNAGATVGIIRAQPLSTITVTDLLPTNLIISGAADVNGSPAWDCSASAAPSTVSCRYIGALPIPAGNVIGNAITVNALATNTGTISLNVLNTASIAIAGQAESPLTNNTALATLLILPPSVDLVSVVSMPTSGFTAGTVVTGTVQFSNIASGNGALTATSAVGTVTLSNGQILTFTLGNLAPGQSTIRSFTTTMPTTGTRLVANSNIKSPELDINLVNNTSTAATPALQFVNLSISKDNGTTTLVAGSTTAYVITVSNGGPSDAGNSVIRDVASAGLFCISVTCQSTSGGASCPAGLTLGSAVPVGSTNFFSSGSVIPAFPPNSTIQLVVKCDVRATGL